MYTKEPDWFEYPDPKEIEHQIDLTYPDYSDIDLEYFDKLEKTQLFFDNIESLLKKYSFRFRYWPQSKRYRIWFKDQHDFCKFNMLRAKSKILKNIVPWRMTRTLDSSGCMDYFVNVKICK